MLRLRTGWGRDEMMLRRGITKKNEQNVSKWKGVTVERRVTRLDWHKQGLYGTILVEIEALSALTRLYLNNNKLS